MWTFPPANFAPPNLPERRPKRGCATSCKSCSPREILLPRQPGLFAQSRPGRGRMRAARAGCAKASRRASKSGFSAPATASACSPSSSACTGSRASAWPGTRQAICAAGAMVHYLRETSAKTERRHCPPRCLHLDPRPLLRATGRAGARSGHRAQPGTGRAALRRGSPPRQRPTSLLAALDETATGMGARLLRAWILRPEIDRDEIAARLDAVAELKAHTVLREEIRQNLARRAGPRAPGQPRHAGRRHAARSAGAAPIPRAHSAAAPLPRKLQRRRV